MRNFKLLWKESMKKYCVKLLIFVVVTGLLFGTFFLISGHEPYRSVLMYITNSEQYGNEPSQEIIPYIEQVEKASDYTKLIVGDSVCHQLFNPFQKYNKVYCTVGSNQAITMIGQYLLIKQFLENHSGVSDVYLILNSMTGSGLDNGMLAYQYLVIPFSETGLLQDATDDTKRDLENKYGKFFMRPEVIRFIDNSPMAKKIYLNTFRNENYDDMIMSVQYFDMIMKLCDQYGVQIHLLHSPMCESSREMMIQQKEKDIEACVSDVMREKIEEYYESIVYYPDEYFSDGIHFGEDYREEYQLAQYIKDMMQKDKALYDFALQP